ncbi:MAG: hypothetical protein DIZ77_05385 [endosymbiont of Seepiophila jonesi]|uniref:Uncharacterized protein n=1 Tax=endosymbiont of Lamellibrachia luymesi TaxID=2200907 RepID=A0A370DUD8_9GAMM|nr:MAG: hypothetical protein DIZ79_13780 [endosymbiont of Lamellibrachia luymesi]RDH93631.1 MAG: hypothetical protein DIZ77_05385 [endosymbiont of Seepiophila jonesi]
MFVTNIEDIVDVLVELPMGQAVTRHAVAQQAMPIFLFLLRYCYCNASIIAKFLVWVAVVKHGWPLLGRTHVNFLPLSALPSAFVHRCRDFFAREGLRATFGFFMVFLRKR